MGWCLFSLDYYVRVVGLSMLLKSLIHGRLWELFYARECAFGGIAPVPGVPGNLCGSKGEDVRTN